MEMRIISYRLYTISYQIWYEFFACFFLMLVWIRSGVFAAAWLWGAVCRLPAINLPVQSVVVGEVGRCVGVRWRAGGCVGNLRTGPIAAGVRV